MPATFLFLAPVVSLAVILFVSTNLDDIFVLLGFFADPTYRAWSIVLGQYLGILVLVALSVVAAFIAFAVPVPYVGFLGVAPMLIGARQLRNLTADKKRAEAELERHPAGGRTQVLSVMLVVMANGGDNIGVYVPVFAGRSWSEIAVIVAVFALMAGIWLFFAHWMVNHRRFGAPIRRYGVRLVPFILIALGLLVLSEAGSFGVLAALL